MNVLSLFDGMSGAQQALSNLDKEVDSYYSSEIDKYAMQVTRKNFPNTKFIGSVTEIDVSALPTIDLLIGGSPCQGFSFSGKRKGASTQCNIEIISLDQYLDLKISGFEFNGQSYLFWEYVRIYDELKKINKDIKFLLENVKMERKWKDIFDNTMGIPAIEINSALTSAQNRIRYYWTNIIQLGLPDDAGRVLDDIILDLKGYKYGTCDVIDYNTNSKCHHIANANDFNGNETITRVYAKSGKCPTLTTMQGGHRQPKIYTGNNTYRKLSTNEFEVLQNVRVGYTSIGIDINLKEVIISNTQRNKMIGNGFTIDIIAHLLQNI